MDPITRAGKVFLKEAAAHWRARRGHVLFMEAAPSSRSDLIKSLRLVEWDPACRRPLFLFEEPCSGADSYFAALSVKLLHDYAELRRGAAEEGIPLPELTDPPERSRLGDRRAPAHALAGLRAREIAQALDGKLDGIDVALVPKQTPAPQDFRDAVATLAAELARTGARLWVLAPPGGPLSDMTEGRTAHFCVDPDELADYLKRLGNRQSDGPAVSSPGAGAAQEPSAEEATGHKLPTAEASKRLRNLLLDATRASRRRDHAGAVLLFGQARTWCQSQGWMVEEVVVLVAMAGAYLAAGAGDLAAGSYQHASSLAVKTGAYPLAAQAALGAGGVRMQQKRYADAMAAYAAAGDAAERGQVPMLHAEALRMEGTAALAAGHHGEALRVSRKAVEIGAQETDETGTSDIDVANVLRRPLPFGGEAAIPTQEEAPISPAAPVNSATMEIHVATLFKAAMPFHSGAAVMPATVELPGTPGPLAPPPPSPAGKRGGTKGGGGPG